MSNEKQPATPGISDQVARMKAAAEAARAMMGTGDKLRPYQIRLEFINQEMTRTANLIHLKLEHKQDVTLENSHMQHLRDRFMVAIDEYEKAHHGPAQEAKNA